MAHYFTFFKPLFTTHLYLTTMTTTYYRSYPRTDIAAAPTITRESIVTSFLI